MSPTVLTAEFMHESNTFSQLRTSLAQFEEDTLIAGEAALVLRGDSNTELAGFLDVAKPAGWQVIHTVSTHARANGRVTRAAFETIAGKILAVAEANRGRIDGVLLALHGSMGLEDQPDGEGELLTRLRAVLGAGVPIAVTLDLHAMVTQTMIEEAQILVSYRTYPHVDMRRTGAQAARLLARTMAGEIAPRSLAIRPPMLFEGNGGRSDMPRTRALYDAAEAAERGGVLAVSVNAGFSGADAAFSGPTVVAVYDSASPAARSEAAQITRSLAQRMWEDRQMEKDPVLQIPEAVALCKAWDKAAGPLVMAETSDNPGSGAYGDSTNLLAALLAADVDDCVFAPVIDPAAAAFLNTRSEGETVTLKIGGCIDPDFGGGPLEVTGRILRLSRDGTYTGDGPIHGGLTLSFGPTAVLQVGGIRILIVTAGRQILDLAQLRAFGIDPLTARVLSIKSKQHFRAAFEPIAGRVIVCDAGGLATTDLSRRPYVRVPRPIWPLDPPFSWSATDAALLDGAPGLGNSSQNQPGQNEEFF